MDCGSSALRDGNCCCCDDDEDGGGGGGGGRDWIDDDGLWVSFFILAEQSSKYWPRKASGSDGL